MTPQTLCVSSSSSSAPETGWKRATWRQRHHHVQVLMHLQPSETAPAKKRRHGNLCSLEHKGSYAPPCSPHQEYARWAATCSRPAINAPNPMEYVPSHSHDQSQAPSAATNRRPAKHAHYSAEYVPPHKRPTSTARDRPTYATSNPLLAPTSVLFITSDTPTSSTETDSVQCSRQ
ncbi:hypothetical protein PF005_g13826 [Phytophthora fragariae]|uniref:Uncharacterized protein n=1 Tax=Phytophthora fragariae TaxID=53985 RepID=A0A6A3KHV9_9STRA|nr:hypothetical protein PF003_g40759 [Phytophthora fragariae]KAE8934670.1 hypothetical protein PF009_g15357 [Phytophthora fragariae]KAE9003404.1 hypothetical protein PF011_g12908 [Phytophthora fragariae]KAE9103840.1 hypothetical protein PF007_g14260 [Phytophthora fragariae]KAE9104185.1 hypothetical protein PF010_g13472 [Phytophthora fragariae]